ncbi:hypothetical protein [Pseudomonas lini]|uniref:hypothetical protein n=1 Tax=Pseudomonas lini TaxID=163011 RepID=UPI00345EC361
MAADVYLTDEAVLPGRFEHRAQQPVALDYVKVANIKARYTFPSIHAVAFSGRRGNDVFRVKGLQPGNRYTVLIFGGTVPEFIDFVNVTYVKAEPIPARTVGLMVRFCRCVDNFGFGA